MLAGGPAARERRDGRRAVSARPPRPCDRYHLTTCGLNVINAAKALVRSRKAAAAMDSPWSRGSSASTWISAQEKRLERAVEALKAEENKERDERRRRER